MKVLLVCTGNICRSPTAAAVLAALAAQRGVALQVDSAGTIDYHAGEPADRRALATARARGYDMEAHRARQVRREDYEIFDLILALDRGHLRELEARRPAGSRADVALLTSYAEVLGSCDVPDPYYGAAGEFEHVLDMIETACEGFLSSLPPVR
jgi:protein-tyrosine phosphatase